MQNEPDTSAKQQIRPTLESSRTDFPISAGAMREYTRTMLINLIRMNREHGNDVLAHLLSIALSETRQD